MEGNPRKAKKNQVLFPATGPSPADFPLGSPESRAAARLVLTSQRSANLSQYDQDAFTIHCHSIWVPDRELWERSAVYQRGEEIAQLVRPRSQEEINAFSRRSIFASIAFHQVHYREPENGDTLSYDELAQVLPYDRVLLEADFQVFAAAWQRQFPGVPLRDKFQSGRYFRLTRHGRDEVWEPAGEVLFDVRRMWRLIEYELQFLDEPAPSSPEYSAFRLAKEKFDAEVRPEHMPTIPKVRFLGIVRGRHACVAA